MDSYLEWLTDMRAWLYEHEPELLRSTDEAERPLTFLERLVLFPIPGRVGRRVPGARG